MNYSLISLCKKHLFKFSTRKFSGNSVLHSVSKETVESLERLALVDFSTAAGIQRLEKSIQFADNLMEVNTDSVEPLINTVYDRNENLRNDEAKTNFNRKELMEIAPVSEEFYYVAPLGTYSTNQQDKS
ncbi:glutamyl-tRNA(Gln) amidotransferase subunit C, mitochondrial [Parasteatoda tepidariorum]|uniref:glutamyl-tRNA(Gln) amidotransferase subunit C, mitochondrial n=1 Tax=Parasteatoda tepidariorum TaxID=114398 RepID=UPI001C71D4D0|nr:glutamyl-tRNA(Gln) amidotransferase subunit C, mitochondrial [Parasteatoda tepidariorum]